MFTDPELNQLAEQLSVDQAAGDALSKQYNETIALSEQIKAQRTAARRRTQETRQKFTSRLYSQLDSMKDNKAMANLLGHLKDPGQMDYDGDE